MLAVPTDDIRELTSKRGLRAGSRNSTANFDDAPLDSPEANGPRAIRSFCESGSNNNGGEEVLHLPVIVESAESSPSAAASAAIQIKRFLGKEWSPKPHVQYNAIMLIRILSDNPGPQFTRNFDRSFVATVKDLLRNCKDASTQQIMRETLDHLENDKANDEGLQLLFAMWRKEKGQGASFSQGGHRGSYMAPNGFQQPVLGTERSMGLGRRSKETGLPTAVELASRVEEAKNTAKILLQLVQSTPTEELLSNELIKEFSERCHTAQKSMQIYINADNPAPDHDTMQTLIETNEQLSLATSRYQRALLAARRAMGASPSPQQNQQASQQGTHAGYGAFAGPPPAQQQQPGAAFTPAPVTQSNGYNHTPAHQTYGGYQAPAGPPPNSSLPPQIPHGQQADANPFADPEPSQYGAFQAPSQQQGHHPQTVSFDEFDRQQQPVQHSRTFTIENEPTFAAPDRRNTNELENAYSHEQQKVSPVQSREDHAVSPSSPQRPALGAYHQSNVTQSYVGRQESALNGLTMHGAGGAPTPHEQYDVSPVETRR